MGFSINSEIKAAQQSERAWREDGEMLKKLGQRERADYFLYRARCFRQRARFLEAMRPALMFLHEQDRTGVTPTAARHRSN